jgi:hypothetical protein
MDLGVDGRGQSHVRLYMKTPARLPSGGVEAVEVSVPRLRDSSAGLRELGQRVRSDDDPVTRPCRGWVQSREEVAWVAC